MWNKLIPTKAEKQLDAAFPPNSKDGKQKRSNTIGRKYPAKS